VAKISPWYDRRQVIAFLIAGMLNRKIAPRGTFELRIEAARASSGAPLLRDTVTPLRRSPNRTDTPPSD
jgi:hypothetical protein